MDRPAQAQLLHQLRAKRKLLAKRWYQAIVSTAFTPLTPAAACYQLARLVEQIATIWLSDPFDAQPASTVGNTLARLHFSQPDTLSQTQIVLADLLMEGLDDAAKAQLYPRLIAVLGMISAGMLAQVQVMILEEQEQLRQALLAARAWAEAARQESDERFRQLAEHIREVFWLVDLDLNRVIYVSPAYETIWGASVEHVYDEQFSFLAAIHPDDRPMVERALDHLADGVFAAEYRIVRSDGELRWIRGRAFPIRRGTGDVWRVAGIAEDITADKLAEAERLALEHQLFEHQRMESLGLLAGGIAHDFNNLLTIMLGNASLVLRGLPPDSLLRKPLEAIAAAARHGAELPRQMLAYAGKGAHVIERIDLNDLVRETSALVTPSVNKNVTLHYQFAANLPEIEADPGQLRQVVMNLVINAAEALADQPGDIRITTAVWQVDHGNVALPKVASTLADGTYVCLTVADTGGGMDPETQARIFEPFFSTKFTGRGLGLAAVAGIIRRQRGAVAVESERGRGAIFTILLPAATAAVASPAGVEVPSFADVCGSVLVIDDEAGVRQVAAATLEQCGYRVCLASNGREGLARLKEQAGEIGCVVLDMTMPGLSGEATLAAIRDHDPAMPVILMSGHDVEVMWSHLDGNGMIGFLQKPFSITTIQQAIMQVLTQTGQVP